MKRYISTLYSICNRRLFALSAFLFSAGIFTGIFCGLLLPGKDGQILSAQLSVLFSSGTNHAMPFLILNLTLLLIIALCGFSVYGFPLSFIILFSKSIAFGLCAALYFISDPYTSAANFIFRFLLPNILVSFLLLVFTAACSSYGYLQLAGRK